MERSSWERHRRLSSAQSSEDVESELLSEKDES